jgi:hypothetical protein
MLLARLLNACHHFPGFVYAAVRLIQATNTIEVDVRARRVSKPHCSCCGNIAPGYDVLAVRRFEFIPIWGLAAKFLDAWCKRAMRSRIEPVKRFARTVRAHRELLLNYFKAKKQFSSGIIEGLNNKAKVTMRKEYGYMTFRIAELSLYHVLGRLPEPKLAHRFFWRSKFRILP